MTSALQQPRHADEQPARRFVGFPFRLHAHPRADGARNVRRLDRQVMSHGVDGGLDRLEAGVQLASFLHLGRSRVVRCDVSFDDDGSNDTQVMQAGLARTCAKNVTEGF
jgi:hypothetical protein